MDWDALDGQDGQDGRDVAGDEANGDAADDDADDATGGVAWVSLADATRITGRQDTTIRHWVRLGNAAADAHPAADRAVGVHAHFWQRHPELFRPGEALRDERTRGTGQGYAIRLDALERVHRARGGVYWHPDARNASQRQGAALALELQRELEQVRAQLAALQRENARLRNQQAATPAKRPAATRLPKRRPVAPADNATPVAVDDRGERDEDRELAVPLDAPTVKPTAADIAAALPLPDGWEPLAWVGDRHGFTRGVTSYYRDNKMMMERFVHSDRLWRVILPSGRPRVVKNVLDPQGASVFGALFVHNKPWQFCGRPGCAACAGARRWLAESRLAQGEARGLDDEETLAELEAMGMVVNATPAAPAALGAGSDWPEDA